MGAQYDHRSQRPLILARRGASHSGPENTMAAFRLAAELGADGIKLDGQLCKDGEAILIHNFAVDETTEGSGRDGNPVRAVVKPLGLCNSRA